MSDYEIISIMLGLLTLSVSFLAIIVKLILAYIDAKNNRPTTSKLLDDYSI